MDFSLGSVLAMIVFGVSGFFVFKEGRRTANLNQVVLGIALMSYSPFTPTVLLNWLVGLTFLAAAYVLR